MNNGISPKGKKWDLHTLKNVIQMIERMQEMEINQQDKELLLKRLNKIYNTYSRGKHSKNTLNKIKAKKIIINWFEGYEEDEPDKPRYYISYKRAHNRVLYLFNKEIKLNGSIKGRKVSFTIIFEDGEKYDGRLYLSPQEDDPRKTSNIFKQHITQYLNYLLNSTKTEDKDKDEIKEFLNKYDLG